MEAEQLGAQGSVEGTTPIHPGCMGVVSCVSLVSLASRLAQVPHGT